jgi:hypothetical protein
MFSLYTIHKHSGQSINVSTASSGSYSFPTSSRNQDNLAWFKATCRRVFFFFLKRHDQARARSRLRGCSSVIRAHASRINEKIGLNYSGLIQIFSSKIALLRSKLPTVICLMYYVDFSWLVDSNLWVTRSSDSERWRRYMVNDIQSSSYDSSACRKANFVKNYANYTSVLEAQNYIRTETCNIIVSISFHVSRDSAVSIATGYGLVDWEVGVRVPVGSRIITSPCRPDRLWGPTNLLYNGYRELFPGGKAAGAWSWPLTSN